MFTNPEFEKLSDWVEWMESVPYEVIRHEKLYTPQELYQGYEPSADVVKDRVSFADCYDSRVYKHFIEQGKISRDMRESVARTIHDHGIHLALARSNDLTKRLHALAALDRDLLSKHLTEAGFYMVSGGGPGAMEATHLGAWMAGRTDEEAQEAIRLLTAAATSFKDTAWVSSALDIMKRYPQTQYVSLGIPTWLYGHEPSTPFATHIAKYFVNSVREDTILTVAFGGIIYTPGSAGTLQEIFQNAVQNHYLSLGLSSPMIFMGKKFWTEEVPAWKLIQHMVGNGRYQNLLLTLTDDLQEIESVLKDFQKTLPCDDKGPK